jgi:hypothetical protein
MGADGQNAAQVTNLSTDAVGVLFSPDGKNLVFTSDVFPECAGQGRPQTPGSRSLTEYVTVIPNVITKLIREQVSGADLAFPAPLYVYSRRNGNKLLYLPAQ